MKIETQLAATLLIMAVALAGCAINRNETSDPQENYRLDLNELHLIGIIDPDGNKSIWLTSFTSYKAMQDILQKYSVNEIEGLKFYKITSWKDTCQIFKATNEQQGRILYSMAHEIKKAKRRSARRVLIKYDSPKPSSNLEEGLTP